METLDLGGRRLAYWDEGEGRPLVFVHGVGTSGELFAGDLAPLAQHCRLIVYDRRGYGASSESPRDWEAHREDAVDLIEALDAAPACWSATAAARSSRWTSRSVAPICSRASSSSTPHSTSSAASLRVWSGLW